ncbi:MAG: hypothetical protein HQL50_14635 [Magnetococcales bacterium]|nr:hypothetical protein [Magnetococcales bacterium]
MITATTPPLKDHAGTRAPQRNSTTVPNHRERQETALYQEMENDNRVVANELRTWESVESQPLPESMGTIITRNVHRFPVG